MIISNSIPPTNHDRKDPHSAEGFCDGLMEDVPELCKRIRSGDTQAFEAFYLQWFDRAFLLARKATGRDESFCFDVIQESMLKLIQSLPVLNHQRAFDAWFSKVIYSTSRDLLRKEIRLAKREQKAITVHERTEVSQSQVSSILEDEERMVWLEKKIKELTLEEQQLLQQRFFLGRSLDQIARGLGISGYSARSRVKRLIKKLKPDSKDGYGFQI